jgi:hypothetical protein
MDVKGFVPDTSRKRCSSMWARWREVKGRISNWRANDGPERHSDGGPEKVARKWAYARAHAARRARGGAGLWSRRN